MAWERRCGTFAGRALVSWQRRFATRSGSAAPEQLAAWVERAMPEPTYTAEQVELRKLWHQHWMTFRDPSSRSANFWANTDVLRSITSSKIPLKATFNYGIYCSILAAPFVFLRDNLMSLQSVEARHLGHELVEGLVLNQHALQSVTGCLASALFLLLSFRVNRSYTRWLNGSSMLADMSSAVRNLILTSQLSITEKRVVVDLGLLAHAYARSVQFHLRRDSDEKIIEVFAPLMSSKQLDALLKAPARPLHVAQHITLMLSQAYDAKQVKNVRLLVLLMSDVNALLRTTQQLQRIQSMPEPWLYLKHMRVTTQIWLGILPFALLPTLGLATSALGPAIAYVVYKMDDVAVELTGPFNHERSDISICMLNDALQRETRSMLLAYVREGDDARSSLWETWGGEPPED